MHRVAEGQSDRAPPTVPFASVFVKCFLPFSPGFFGDSWRTHRPRFHCSPSSRIVAAFSTVARTVLGLLPFPVLFRPLAAGSGGKEAAEVAKGPLDPGRRRKFSGVPRGERRGRPFSGCRCRSPRLRPGFVGRRRRPAPLRDAPICREASDLGPPLAGRAAPGDGRQGGGAGQLIPTRWPSPAKA